MQHFSLDNLLRNTFAGGVMVWTIVLAYPNVWMWATEQVDATLIVSAGLGTIILLGSLLYVLHRAFLYNFIYKRLVTRVYGSAHQVMNLDLARFARIGREASLQKNLVEWSSQVHYLYCSTWAILFGLAMGVPLRRAPSFASLPWLGLLACLTFVGAVKHHQKLLEYDREIASREQSIH